MRDWAGTRSREDAIAVSCRYCYAPAGEPCVTRDKNPRPLTAFPAHIVRTNDATRKAAQ